MVVLLLLVGRVEEHVVLGVGLKVLFGTVATHWLSDRLLVFGR